MAAGRATTLTFSALALVAAGFAAFALLAPDRETAKTPAPPAPPRSAPAAPAADPVTTALDEAAETGAAIAEAAAPEPARDDAAPAFDVVRVERDGAALAAGKAAPDAEVQVLVDGETVARARADSAGDFVAFFDLPRGEGSARRLDLLAAESDGTTRAGDGPVIVAAPDAGEPDAEPMVVASREDGLEVLQKPDPDEDDDSVTLDMATQNPNGTVALSGRAGGLKPLRIYADAKLVAETVADADGRWSAETDVDAASGAATFRVDQVGPDGAVSGRAEVPFRVAEDDAADRAIGPGEVVVRQGDSLWAIAENLLGRGNRYTVIYAANRERIADPNVIFPGQLLTVPGAAAAQ